MACAATVMIDKKTETKQHRLNIMLCGHVQNRSGRGEQRRGRKEPVCRRRNHEWTDDQAARRRLANLDADEGTPQTTTQARYVLLN